MRCRTFAAGVCVLIAAAGHVSAQEAVAVKPTTCSPGATTRLTLAAKNLKGPVRVVCGLPSARADVKEVEAGRAQVDLTLPADAPLGPFALWIATAAGPAAPVSLLVDDLPTVAEIGASCSPESAQPVPTLGAIDGTCNGPVSDFYRFTAEAGQRVAFEIHTQALRSKADPVLRLTDAAGRVLHVADDTAVGPECRFAYRFAETGEYRLEVFDSRYAAGGAYHLRLGDFPLVDHALPLAVRRGEPADIAFAGENGEAVERREVVVPADLSAASISVPARMPGGRSSAWATVLVRDDPRFIEPIDAASDGPTAEPLTAPVGIGGRLDQPGQRDAYRLRGLKGQSIRLAARTRSLGSSAALHMRLLDPAGKPVAETAVTDGDEWDFDAAFPADGVYRLEVRDLLGRGGPGFGYWIDVRPSGSVAVALQAVTVKAVVTTRDLFAVEPNAGGAVLDLEVARFGYDGPLALSLDGAAEGLRLLNPVLPAKTAAARLWVAAGPEWKPDSASVVRLRVRSTDDPAIEVAVESRKLRRLKEPHAPFPAADLDGTVFLAGVPEGKPLFAVEPAAAEFARSERRHEATLNLKRLDTTFKSPVAIFGDDLPPGWDVAVKDEKDAYRLTFTRAADAAGEPESLPLLAAGEHNGRVRIEKVVLPVKWTDPAGTTPDAPTTLVPGRSATAGTTLARPGVASLAALMLAGLPAARSEPARLEVYPPAVTLNGRRSRQQLVVTGIDSSGNLRDWTHDARITSGDPKVAEVRGAVIHPVAAGATEIVVEASGVRAVVPVSVTMSAAERPIAFETEALVALSKQGCNSGACHGSPSGKGGFRLSLRAFDKALDELTLIREEFGRRVNPLDPDRSLLLAKPLMKVPHGGGMQLRKGDEAYAILRDWIAEGAKPDPADAPRCVRLEVHPGTKRVADLAAGGQQFAVTAHFSDGGRRDVTHLVAYESSNTGVATVDGGGRVTPHGRGEAVILVRFLEHIESVPLMFVEEVDGFRWAAPPENNYVDTLVNEKLRRLKYLPAETCGDDVFLRRVHLDVVGVLPTPEEAAAFLADLSPDKRSRLIDRLLERDEYARFWALRWGDLLRMTAKTIGDEGVYKYHRWVERSIRENRPYDEFARALLTGSGSTLAEPPASFYRAAADANECVETVSQVFLGARLQCAKCHNHPFERWTQDNYYGLGAFFERVKRTKTLRPGETFVWAADAGEVVHPRTGRTMRPWLPGVGEIDVPAGEDRRQAFARWLTDPANPYLAKVEANRLWSRLFARGIVDPVDDFRDSNPPTNDRLLDALAKDFAEHGFDRKRLLRTILNSRTYQAGYETNPFNEADRLYFSHQEPRLLSAEQLLDAVNSALGLEQTFGNLPAGTRATHLPAPDVAKVDFLKVFGQPERSTVCACERVGDPNLGMAIELFNGPLIHEKLRAPNNRFRKAVAAGRPSEEVVREMYLASVCRPPSDVELKTALDHCRDRGDLAAGLEDVCWALFNTDEFLFQH